MWICMRIKYGGLLCSAEVIFQPSALYSEVNGMK